MNLNFKMSLQKHDTVFCTDILFEITAYLGKIMGLLNKDLRNIYLEKIGITVSCITNTTILANIKKYVRRIIIDSNLNNFDISQTPNIADVYIQERYRYLPYFTQNAKRIISQIIDLRKIYIVITYNDISDNKHVLYSALLFAKEFEKYGDKIFLKDITSGIILTYNEAFQVVEFVETPKNDKMVY